MSTEAGDPQHSVAPFSWTDGSSIYTLGPGAQFRLEPNGMSGRTIDGCFVHDGGTSGGFVIFGRWAWG